MSWSIIKRQDLDLIKWDTLISNYPTSLPYSHSWYLDITCPNWEAAVLGDYEAICALPYNRKKFRLRQLYTPFFVQQLGWISIQPLPEDKVIELLELINSRYFFVHYAFNESNSNEKSLRQYDVKTNLIIPLSEPYAELSKAYSKGLKYSIKRATKEDLEMISTDFNSNLMDLLYSQLQTRVKKLKSHDYDTIKKLIDFCLDNQYGKLWVIKSKEGETLSLAFFLLHKNRMINLFQASTEEGRKANAISYLFDYMIKTNAENDLIFDFEGSEIPTVQRFMKSFGAVNNPYHVMTKKWRMV